MPTPSISLVIRALNEERHLPRLLEAVRRQTIQAVEVVLVDSGSVDATRDIARNYCDQVVRIDSHNFTFGYSLNTGIRHSTGEYIAIVSAHTKPVRSSWLQDLIAPLHDEHTAMVYGRQVGTASSKFSERRDFQHIFGPERFIVQPPRLFANNANSAIRRDLWHAHPFDETLPGLEDREWAMYWIQQGYRIVYEPRAAIYHVHEESWRQVRRRYYREAMAAKWIGIKGRRHIPLEVCKEVGYLSADLLAAARQPSSWALARESVCFRANKLRGTIRGLSDAAVMGDPRQRQAVFFDTTCKAVVIRRPGHSVFEDVAIPFVRPGEVLIKVAYTGVCGTDLEIHHGTLGYYQQGRASYPIIPGHEFAGKIAKIGANIQHLREGDPVVAECIQSCGKCALCLNEKWIACHDRKEVGVLGLNGAYAEYLVLPGQFVHRIPDHLPLSHAWLCEPLAVVLKGLKRLERCAPLDEVRNIAVIGAGTIGYFTAHLLARRGHQVTISDLNPHRRAYFDGSKITAQAELNDLTPYDIIVEATGQRQALISVLTHSMAGTALLLLGLPYGTTEFSFEEIVAYDKLLVGSVGSSAAEFQQAIELLPQLDLDPLTSSRFPLNEFRAAWQHVAAGQVMKAVLEVEGWKGARPQET